MSTMVETQKNDRTFYDLYIKRVLDVIASFFGIILLLPLFFVISAAIYIDDPGPIFFSQNRIGINKTVFKIYKFRSMKMSAPHNTPTHMLRNAEDYITKVGKIIRKYSLDELPQLLNVLSGKLSLIGPRCALWNQYDLIAERDKYNANDIRPGITGWAQIHGRDELEIAEKARLDGYYASELMKSEVSGFIIDVRCFFGTILSVLRSDGVVEGGTGNMDDTEHKK